MQRVRFEVPALILAALLPLSGPCRAGEADIHYHVERPRTLYRYNGSEIALLEKLNRVDRAHLGRLRQLIVPNRWDLDELAYSPMPRFAPELEGDPKAVVVDIPSQVFGAYEFGSLVRWGPVCTGKRLTQTPPGEYILHWNQRVRISSVDSTWIMPWYFNFDNIIGLGFHEYTMPGVPSSHGCVRMLEADARWLFYWGRRGTRVLVNGQYDFTSGRPWLRPKWWSQKVAMHAPETPGGIPNPAGSTVPASITNP